MVLKCRDHCYSTGSLHFETTHSARKYGDKLKVVLKWTGEIQMYIESESHDWWVVVS